MSTEMDTSTDTEDTPGKRLHQLLCSLWRSFPSVHKTYFAPVVDIDTSGSLKDFLEDLDVASLKSVIRAALISLSALPVTIPPSGGPARTLPEAFKHETRSEWLSFLCEFCCSEATAAVADLLVSIVRSCHDVVPVLEPHQVATDYSPTQTVALHDALFVPLPHKVLVRKAQEHLVFWAAQNVLDLLSNTPAAVNGVEPQRQASPALSLVLPLFGSVPGVPPLVKKWHEDLKIDVPDCSAAVRPAEPGQPNVVIANVCALLVADRSISDQSLVNWVSNLLSLPFNAGAFAWITTFFRVCMAYGRPDLLLVVRRKAVQQLAFAVLQLSLPITRLVVQVQPLANKGQVNNGYNPMLAERYHSQRAQRRSLLMKLAEAMLFPDSEPTPFHGTLPLWSSILDILGKEPTPPSPDQSATDDMKWSEPKQAQTAVLRLNAGFRTSVAQFLQCLIFHVLPGYPVLYSPLVSRIAHEQPLSRDEIKKRIFRQRRVLKFRDETPPWVEGRYVSAVLGPTQLAVESEFVGLRVRGYLPHTNARLEGIVYRLPGDPCFEFQGTWTDSNHVHHRCPRKVFFRMDPNLRSLHGTMAFAEEPLTEVTGVRFDSCDTSFEFKESFGDQDDTVLDHTSTVRPVVAKEADFYKVASAAAPSPSSVDVDEKTAADAEVKQSLPPGTTPALQAPLGDAELAPIDLESMDDAADTSNSATAGASSVPANKALHRVDLKPYPETCVGGYWRRYNYEERSRALTVRNSGRMVHLNESLWLFGGALAGGGVSNDLFYFPLKLRGQYDNAEWVRMPLQGQRPSGRSDFGFAAAGNSLFLFGGCQPVGNVQLGDMWVFDIKADTWSVIGSFGDASDLEDEKKGAPPRENPPADADAKPADKHDHHVHSPWPCARSKCEMVTSSDGRYLYLFGGITVGTNTYVEDTSEKYLNDLWQFDVEKKCWRCLCSATTAPVRLANVVAGQSWPCKRYMHAMCVLGERLFLFGGRDAYGVHLNDFWFYDTRTGVWTMVHDSLDVAAGVCPSPRCRLGAGAANGSVWIFGGWEKKLTFARARDLWRYDVPPDDPAAGHWTLVMPLSGGPRAVNNHFFVVFEDHSSPPKPAEPVMPDLGLPQRAPVNPPAAVATSSAADQQQQEQAVVARASTATTTSPPPLESTTRIFLMCGQISPPDATTRRDMWEFVPMPSWLCSYNSRDWVLIPTFDGATGFINLRSPSAFSFPGARPYCIEIWMMPTHDNRYQRSFSKVNQNKRGEWSIDVSRDGLKIDSHRECEPFHVVTEPMTPNRWHHIVSTYDGRQLRVYIDAKLKCQIHMGLQQEDRDSDCLIGAGHMDNRVHYWFNGLLLEARIWHSARAPTRDSIQTPLHGTEPNLSGYWPLWGHNSFITSGAGAMDRSVKMDHHGRHGMVNDGVRWVRAPLQLLPVYKPGSSYSINNKHFLLYGSARVGPNGSSLRLVPEPAREVLSGSAFFKKRVQVSRGFKTSFVVKTKPGDWGGFCWVLQAGSRLRQRAVGRPTRRGLPGYHTINEPTLLLTFSWVGPNSPAWTGNYSHEVALIKIHNNVGSGHSVHRRVTSAGFLEPSAESKVDISYDGVEISVSYQGSPILKAALELTLELQMYDRFCWMGLLSSQPHEIDVTSWTYESNDCVSKRLQKMVPSASLQECRDALVQCGEEIGAAEQHLKSDPATRAKTVPVDWAERAARGASPEQLHMRRCIVGHWETTNLNVFDIKDEDCHFVRGYRLRGTYTSGDAKLCGLLFRNVEVDDQGRFWHGFPEEEKNLRLPAPSTKESWCFLAHWQGQKQITWKPMRLHFNDTFSAFAGLWIGGVKSGPAKGTRVAMYDPKTPVDLGKKGLFNLGNTCYMNSFLQSLYMTTSLRNAVLSAPFDDALDLNVYDDGRHDISLYDAPSAGLTVRKLQAVFMHLLVSQRPFHEPSKFQKSLPEQWRGNNQQDTAEFGNFLLDQLAQGFSPPKSQGDADAADEKGAKGQRGGAVPAAQQKPNDSDNTAAAGKPNKEEEASNPIKDMFEGTLTNAIRCSECNNLSLRTEPFKSLQLHFPSNYSPITDLDVVTDKEIPPTGFTKIFVDIHAGFPADKKAAKPKKKTVKPAAPAAPSSGGPGTTVVEVKEEEEKGPPPRTRVFLCHSRDSSRKPLTDIKVLCTPKLDLLLHQRKQEAQALLDQQEEARRVAQEAEAARLLDALSLHEAASEVHAGDINLNIDTDVDADVKIDMDADADTVAGGVDVAAADAKPPPPLIDLQALQQSVVAEYARQVPAVDGAPEKGMVPAMIKNQVPVGYELLAVNLNPAPAHVTEVGLYPPVYICYTRNEECGSPLTSLELITGTVRDVGPPKGYRKINKNLNPNGPFVFLCTSDLGCPVVDIQVVTGGPGVKAPPGYDMIPVNLTLQHAGYTAPSPLDSSGSLSPVNSAVVAEQKHQQTYLCYKRGQGNPVTNVKVVHTRAQAAVHSSIGFTTLQLPRLFAVPDSPASSAGDAKSKPDDEDEDRSVMAPAPYLCFKQGDGCPIKDIQVYRGYNEPAAYGDIQNQYVCRMAAPPVQPIATTWSVNLAGQDSIMGVQVVNPNFRGKRVTGSYGYQGGSLNGIASLNADGCWTWVGTFRIKSGQKEQGHATFRFSRDGSAFDGFWTYGAKMARWSGRRLGMIYDRTDSPTYRIFTPDNAMVYVSVDHLINVTPGIHSIQDEYIAIDEVPEMGQGAVTLRSAHGRYFAADDAGRVTCHHMQRLDSCLFFLDKVNDRTIIRTLYGYILTVDEISSLSARMPDEVVEAECGFRLERVEQANDSSSVLVGMWETNDSVQHLNMDLRVNGDIIGEHVQAKIVPSASAHSLWFNDDQGRRVLNVTGTPGPFIDGHFWTAGGGTPTPYLQGYWKYPTAKPDTCHPFEFQFELDRRSFKGWMVAGDHRQNLRARVDDYVCIGTSVDHHELWRDGRREFASVAPREDIDSLLGQFLRKQVMDGANRYRCYSKQCQNKLVRAEQYVRISSAPSHLLVTLKRFSYDYRTGVKSKIFDKVDIPISFRLPVEDPGNADVVPSQRLYCLYAVIVHSGTSANVGHYFCYARESSAPDLHLTESKHAPWFKFDDTKVSRSLFKDLKESTNSSKQDSAYILFYVHKKEEDVTDVEDDEKAADSADPSSAGVGVSDAAVDEEAELTDPPALTRRRSQTIGYSSFSMDSAYPQFEMEAVPLSQVLEDNSKFQTSEARGQAVIRSAFFYKHLINDIYGLHKPLSERLGLPSLPLITSEHSAGSALQHRRVLESQLVLDAPSVPSDAAADTRALAQHAAAKGYLLYPHSAIRTRQRWLLEAASVGAALQLSPSSKPQSTQSMLAYCPCCGAAVDIRASVLRSFLQCTEYRGGRKARPGSAAVWNSIRDYAVRLRLRELERAAGQVVMHAPNHNSTAHSEDSQPSFSHKCPQVNEWVDTCLFCFGHFLRGQFDGHQRQCAVRFFRAFQTRKKRVEEELKKIEQQTKAVQEATALAEAQGREVCPLCQDILPAGTTQSEFRVHVNRCMDNMDSIQTI